MNLSANNVKTILPSGVPTPESQIASLKKLYEQNDAQRELVLEVLTLQWMLHPDATEAAWGDELHFVLDCLTPSYAPWCKAQPVFQISVDARAIGQLGAVWQTGFEKTCHDWVSLGEVGLVLESELRDGVLITKELDTDQLLIGPKGLHEMRQRSRVEGHTARLSRDKAPIPTESDKRRWRKAATRHAKAPTSDEGGAL